MFWLVWKLLSLVVLKNVMSKLIKARLQQHLTQDELSERSGISVRTIQRLEAGAAPQGYTLKALAKALAIPEADLLERKPEQIAADHRWAKWINISALPLMFLPPLNVAVPLLLMYTQKQFNPVTKKLVNLQVLWLIGTLLIVIAVMMLNDLFGIRGNYMKLAPVLWILVNVFIILRNAASLNKDNTLRIRLGFDLL